MDVDHSKKKKKKKIRHTSENSSLIKTLFLQLQKLKIQYGVFDNNYLDIVKLLFQVKKELNEVLQPNKCLKSFVT